MSDNAACSSLAVVPKVEVTPKSVTVMQGSNVKAVCSASGSPPPEILWNLDWLSTHHEVSWSSFLFGRGPPTWLLFRSGEDEESFT